MPTEGLGERLACSCHAPPLRTNTYTAPAHEGAEKKDKFNLDYYDEYGRQRTQKGVLRHPSRRSPSPSPSPGTGAR